MTITHIEIHIISGLSGALEHPQTGQLWVSGCIKRLEGPDGFGAGSLHTELHETFLKDLTPGRQWSFAYLRVVKI